MKFNVSNSVAQGKATSPFTVVQNIVSIKSRADNIYQQLKSEGCVPKDIISLSTHLLSFVETELKETHSKE